MIQIKKLTYLAGIVSAAGILSACSTTHRSYASSDRYTSSDMCGDKHAAASYSSQYQQNQSAAYEASGAEAQAPAAPTAAAGATAGPNDVVIPLFEERVNAAKQAVPGGQVQIRKFTTTETVSVPVQIRREHVVVERVPAGGQPGSQSDLAGAPFQDKQITIQLQEEQPLVQKQTVEIGQVIAHKDTQMQQMNVQQQIRREDVRVTQTGNTSGNVELRGNINEAAGAEAPKHHHFWNRDKDKDRDRDQK
jgi:uncharacterized protein (TIGR02271 family)